MSVGCTRGARKVLQSTGLSSAGVKIANSYSLPLSDGTPDQVLQTDGNGQLTFVSVDPGSSPSIPQVLKVGLQSSDLVFSGGGNLQTVQFDHVLFDTFQNEAGYRMGSHDFVAKESGYYDIQVSLVVDQIEDVVTQYQIYLASSGSTHTMGAGGTLPFIALSQYNPNHLGNTPGTVNQRTFHVGTIEYFEVNQSASVVVRQIGGSGNASKVVRGKNKTFLCIKKL